MTSSFPSARLRPFRPLPFGRYTLLSHLATGGMGEIYLARLEGAQGFEKLCVIKKILPQLAEDSEFVARFVGEATTLVKLSHGSIAQVLDMGLHEGEAYMALEYVDGKDLRKVAGRVRDRQMPLPVTFVLYVMGRVLDALAYAHRKRDDDEKEIHLVHRDISPQNILISYEGEVKVIDFGLAKSRLSAAKTNPSIILGKFLYMSPEQARHQPVDRRSDLYAVGLCLYELISGQNPFDNVPPGELMPTVANPRIAALNEVEPLTPPAVAQLVMKALAVDPAQRFQTAEEFRGKLQSCLREIDTNAGPETVSRFMRDLFSTEFQSERKLLAQLKDAARSGEQAARPPAAEAPARVANPMLPPRTIKLDGPVEPLSFQPTPRGRDGKPVTDGETRPGFSAAESTRPGFPAAESTRPGFSAEETTRPGGVVTSPEPASRARVRPSTDSLSSHTTETASIEVGPELFERPSPPVPGPSPAAASERSQATTVEVPIPLVPAAAIPPGSRPPEAPRPLMPAPPSASAAARPAPPPAPSRPAPPTLQAESPSTETVRANLPPLPAPAPAAPSPLLTPLPSFSTLMPHSAGSRETTDPAGLPPLAPEPPQFSSPPTAARESARGSGLRPAINERGGASSRSPEPQMSLAEELAARGGVITRSPEPAAASPSGEVTPTPTAPAGGRLSASSRPTEPALAPVPDKLPPGAAEASRRGLDDTHPSFKVKGETPHIHDTQPGVVISEEALADLEAEGEGSSEPIIGGVLEDAPSSAGRPKPPRRLVRASSPGMASVARGGPTGRGGTVRAFEDEDPSGPSGPTAPSEPEFAVPTGEVDVDVDMDMDAVGKDPRDNTRRTPIPTRPGEPGRRMHRDEARHETEHMRAVKKRSWLWPVLTVVLLAVVGGALAMTYPLLKPLVDKTLSQPMAKPPPAVPLPRAVEPEPTPAPAPEAAATPPQAEAPAEVAAAPAPVAPEGVKSAPGSGEEPDMLVPLTAAPPVAKKPGTTRPSRKGTRKDGGTELQKEWALASRSFIKLTDLQSCESPKVGNLCLRFEAMQDSVARAGDANDRELAGKVRKLRNEMDKAIKSLQ